MRVANSRGEMKVANRDEREVVANRGGDAEVANRAERGAVANRAGGGGRWHIVKENEQGVANRGWEGSVAAHEGERWWGGTLWVEDCYMRICFLIIFIVFTWECFAPIVGHFQ